MSKEEIPEYHWTEEAELRLAELVKENPQLYDKKQKEWLNVAAKNSRWDRVAEQLEPPAIVNKFVILFQNTCFSF